MLQIEFICLIINRMSLDRVYPGGSAEFITQHGPFQRRSADFDAHLIRFGAMDPSVIEDLIEMMVGYGLVGLATMNGEKRWVDFCVIEELMGLRARCEWVKYDDRERTVTYVEY